MQFFHYLSLIFCFLSLQATGQYDTLTRISDMNRDGFSDTLISFYQGGSGFGGRYATIISGANGERFSMNTDGCFCEIKRGIFIPKHLALSQNQSFLDTLVNVLLPPRKNRADPSLEWLIQAGLNRKEIVGDSLFSEVIAPKINWSEGDPEIPENYFIEMHADYVLRLTSPYELNKDSSKSDRGFLIYAANNHFDDFYETFPTEVAENSTYRISKTKHGVIAQKGNLHKWLFITDQHLTGAPDKLRWKSIGRIVLIQKYLIVEQIISPIGYNLTYLIDIETGLVGQITGFSSKNWDIVNADKNTLTFQVGDNKTAVNLFDLITHFDRLNHK